MGYAFDRRPSILSHSVDFFCSALRLAVEIDAVARSSLRALRSDARRDARLAQLGITVLRFTDDEIVHNLDGVLTSIRRRIRSASAHAPASRPGAGNQRDRSVGAGR